MTSEERFAKIEENILVITETQRRSEGTWNARFTQLADIVDRIALNQDQHELRITQIERSLAALIETVNRFIQGRGGNGQRPPDEPKDTH